MRKHGEPIHASVWQFADDTADSLPLIRKRGNLILKGNNLNYERQKPGTHFVADNCKPRKLISHCTRSNSR